MYRSRLEEPMWAALRTGRRYVQLDSPSTHVKLAIYERRSLPKDIGPPPDCTASCRVVIRSAAGPFTDPDGFAWEPA